MTKHFSSRFVGALCGLLLFVGIAHAGEIKGKVTGPAGTTTVVYVDAIPGQTFPAPTKHTTMDQKNLKFDPHVLVVLKGTTVDFLNSDTVLHNVFWPSISGNKKLTQNLGTWPKGEHKSYTFDIEGVAPLLCNVHPEMAGYVVVVPTPYFAVTDATGNFDIKDVPAGKYTLKTWSEKGKPTTAPVEVTTGIATINLTVSK